MQSFCATSTRRGGGWAGVVWLAVMAGALGGCEAMGLMAMRGANVLSSMGPHERVRDVRYGPGESHRLDVYMPTRGEPPYPVVVFFHGGDWSEGYPDKDMYPFVGDALTRRGMVAVVANYRRYPTARFPAFVEDGARAVVWTREHIAAYGGDADAMFVMGHSAGAHIASMVALDERYMREAGGDRAWIRGMIGMAGPYSFPPRSEMKLLSEVFEGGQAYGRSQPINYVDAGDPPMLLLSGGRDERVPTVVTERMERRVRSVAGRVETITYGHLDHIMLLGSFAPPVRWGEPVLDHVAGWVARESASDGDEGSGGGEGRYARRRDRDGTVEQ